MSALLTDAEMKHMTSKYAGLTPYTYTSGFLTLACWFEYAEAERGSRENGTGLQLEPDYPATADLVYAQVAGIDIYDVLSADVIAAIEAAFLAQG